MKGEAMEYQVYTGMYNDSVVTVMIADDTGDPADYFLAGTTDIEHQGSVEVSGAAEDALPGDMHDGF
jgi:hypothetical protein